MFPYDTHLYTTYIIIDILPTTAIKSKSHMRDRGMLLSLSRLPNLCLVFINANPFLAI